MIEPENRLQDRENFKVELEPCSQCRRKDRLVNSKVGQAYCRLCQGLSKDKGLKALDTLAKLTTEEIHTMTEDELNEYHYRVEGDYIKHFYGSETIRRYLK